MTVFLRALVVVLCALTLVSCKIVQRVSPGGKVVSQTTLNDCGEGRVCAVQPEAGALFVETFTAQPEPGYEFVGWEKAPGYLCGGKADSCAVTVPATLTGFAVDMELSALFAPEGTHRVEITTGPNGTAYGWSEDAARCNPVYSEDNVCLLVPYNSLVLTQFVPDDGFTLDSFEGCVFTTNNERGACRTRVRGDVLVTGEFTSLDGVAPTVSLTDRTTLGGDKLWSVYPYVPGIAALDGFNVGGYGGRLEYPYEWPRQVLKGKAKIPVFLVDFEDYEPTDANPAYVRQSAEALDAFLNGENGVGDYFREVSAGQLDLAFDVMPWIRTDESDYLRTRAYYADDANIDGGDRLNNDVLRSAVAELGVDFRDYDADGNGFIDGLVFVYEGRSGGIGRTLAGKATVSCCQDGHIYQGIATLVDESDPNYSLFQDQRVLYGRYAQMEEQRLPHLPFTSTTIWAHELGHVIMGFTDYYHALIDTSHSDTPLYGNTGSYLLSAHGGHDFPFHPSAWEKWRFGRWVDSVAGEYSGRYSLDSHHIKPGEHYDPEANYLMRIPLGRPGYYLAIENRYFLPAAQGGSYFNDAPAEAEYIESGLIIFEVDERKFREYPKPYHVSRLMPERMRGTVVGQRHAGAFQPGDELVFDSADGQRITLSEISPPGDRIDFTLSFEELAP